MSEELAKRLTELGRSLSVIHHAGEKTCAEAVKALRTAEAREKRLRVALEEIAVDAIVYVDLAVLKEKITDRAHAALKEQP